MFGALSNAALLIGALHFQERNIGGVKTAFGNDTAVFHVRIIYPGNVFEQRSMEIPLRHQRTAELMQIGKESAESYVQSWLGKEAEVLIEENDEGYTREYVHAKVCGQSGQIVRVTVSGIEGETALCTPLP